ncbi:MAG: nuclear transport factor 2 family protein [Deltaproteobacteria bacterium]|nr:nuclear transport factor 2 family protein [Deltaproteobacteria bacterium]MBW2420337.1 nuclear transport factor 2 family protein [Deltaproteobacteria bacterium]
MARRLWEGISGADLYALRELFSSKLEWTSHGRSPLAGHYSGPDAALELMARSGELVDELSANVVEMYASESGAVVRYRVQASRGPLHLDTEHLLILEIDDEEITGIVTVPVDQYANDRFFAMQ